MIFKIDKKFKRNEPEFSIDIRGIAGLNIVNKIQEAARRLRDRISKQKTEKPVKGDFINLFEFLDVDKLESKKIIMREADFDRLMRWGIPAFVQAAKRLIAKRKAIKKANKFILSSAMDMSKVIPASYIKTKTMEESFYYDAIFSSRFVRAVKALLAVFKVRELQTVAEQFISRVLKKDTEQKTIMNILETVVEDPDKELSTQDATTLCLGLVTSLDDEELVEDAYRIISHYLHEVDEKVRDKIIPSMVVHDL